MSSSRTIRIATRSSRLALWQAEHVASLLRQSAPDVPVEIVHVSTLGDRDVSGPLKDLGTWGVFTREVQRVVLDEQADLAVHSLKDLPTERVEGLVLAAVPERGTVHDAFVAPAGSPGLTFETLPESARVGTGSLRRQAQLRHIRPDLVLADVRGNVETRLRKLDAGEYDALILAVAGLERLELAGRITQRLGPPTMYPAVGQGALGLECRESDDWLREILKSLEHVPTRAAVTAERALLAELRGGCHAPLGVACRADETSLQLEAVVLSPDGRQRLQVAEQGVSSASDQVGRTAAHALQAQGADALIAASRDT